MECLLLPNELFDDGSHTCKTFTLLTHTECVITDWDRISTLKAYEGIREAIKYAVRHGYSHMDTKHLGLKTSYGDPVIQISWD